MAPGFTELNCTFLCVCVCVALNFKTFIFFFFKKEINYAAKQNTVTQLSNYLARRWEPSVIRTSGEMEVVTVKITVSW